MKKEKWNGKWLDLNKENCKWHYYSKYNANDPSKYKEVTQWPSFIIPNE